MPAPALATLAVALLAQSEGVPAIVPLGAVVAAFGILGTAVGWIYKLQRTARKDYEQDAAVYRQEVADAQAAAQKAQRRNMMLTELVGSIVAKTGVEVPAGFWERYWQ